MFESEMVKLFNFSQFLNIPAVLLWSKLEAESISTVVSDLKQSARYAANVETFLALRVVNGDTNVVGVEADLKVL